ncbi:MAG: 16S rRNA (cytosine(967)-C(5))-methyltransferase RsmB [bacterium]|nr:16S rRNA (cytosine(967)-C(5))-methyltransferase RsmB [bacterium]MCM1376512.1 16S rRNA (cytosine(967)-C(5))-methyltransferase RsmB [Muribaculum sp.]MCM1410836.1 16S rRNA (cytosine(967)-C(5))-methyltransferase RsmB [Lachnospiraceae bacterium]
MANNIREIVLDALLVLERGTAYSSQIIKAVLDKYDYLPEQEKRFVKRLTEGCVERRIELDYILDRYSTVPANRMKPVIRCLMRMGVYQLLYMDGVPDSAVCNEAVKLAGKRKFVNLKGFVNGVLRKIASQKGNIPLPDVDAEPVRALSVQYSMPEWIVRLWLEEYGREQTCGLLECLLEVRPVTVRFAPRVTPQQRQGYIDSWQATGVRVTQSEYLEYAYYLEGVGGVASLKGYDEGAFVVQDVSSMLCVEAAGLREGDIVMDVCAAPGGKALLAAQTAAHVLARDVSEKKLQRMRENVQRMGLEHRVTTQLWDATEIDENRIESADAVFMDVPCSGLGVLGKKRDIKYHVTPESLESLIQLQRRIIQGSWQYVKPGGVLIYSTCTINRRENEEACRFICDHYPFTLEESRQLMPQEAHQDGFFYARLRRRPTEFQG